jgi:hypothetical protein
MLPAAVTIVFIVVGVVAGFLILGAKVARLEDRITRAENALLENRNQRLKP